MKINVWIKRPGNKPERTWIDTADIENIIGGPARDYNWADGETIICNKYCNEADLPINFISFNRTFKGTCVFAGKGLHGYRSTKLTKSMLDIMFPRIMEG